MRSLVYTIDCKNIFPCKRTRKELFLKHIETQNLKLVTQKTTSQYRYGYKSINKNQLPTTLQRLFPFKILHFNSYTLHPSPVCHNHYKLQNRSSYTPVFLALKRLESVEKAKRSKQLRREALMASHGVSRRSLYEVTINSIGKPQGISENAQNKAF